MSSVFIINEPWELPFKWLNKSMVNKPANFSVLVYGAESILFKHSGLKTIAKYEKYSLNIWMNKDATITTKTKTWDQTVIYAFNFKEKLC